MAATAQITLPALRIETITLTNLPAGDYYVGVVPYSYGSGSAYSLRFNLTGPFLKKHRNKIALFVITGPMICRTHCFGWPPYLPANSSVALFFIPAFVSESNSLSGSLNRPP